MVGEVIAEARQSAGMTIEELAGRTKIRASMIVAMENDDFSACGGEVYARGHLKSIASVLGIDPGRLLDEFDGGDGEG